MRSRFTLVLIASLGLVGCTNMNGESKKEEEHEGDEVKMALADVPAPVQATLKREAAGATIDKVDKETDDGKTIYETDVMVNGKNWEIKVASDGTLISKKEDNEAEEHKNGKHEKEEDEKDEKNEKK